MDVSCVLHGTVLTATGLVVGSINAGSKDAMAVTKQWTMSSRNLLLDRMVVQPIPARLHTLTKQSNFRF